DPFFATPDWSIEAALTRRRLGFAASSAARYRMARSLRWRAGGSQIGWRSSHRLRWQIGWDGYARLRRCAQFGKPRFEFRIARRHRQSDFEARTKLAVCRQSSYSGAAIAAMVTDHVCCRSQGTTAQIRPLSETRRRNRREHERERACGPGLRCQ